MDIAVFAYITWDLYLARDTIELLEVRGLLNLKHVSDSTSRFTNLLAHLPSESVPEISVYLNEACQWGNRTRIDYASGMDFPVLTMIIEVMNMHSQQVGK